MLLEPTTLAATIRLIAETLETDYQTKAEPLFRVAGLDYNKMVVPGARYPWAKLQRLWDLAVEATGDSCFGLTAGRNFRATTFSALSFVWLVSDSLRDSVERMCRYHQVISTVPLNIGLHELDNAYELRLEFPQPEFLPRDVVFDAFYTGVLSLCRMAADSHFKPVVVHLPRSRTRKG